MAEHVFSTPELRQCIKADLLWQLQLALDIRQDEVGGSLVAGLSSTSNKHSTNLLSRLSSATKWRCV